MLHAIPTVFVFCIGAVGCKPCIIKAGPSASRIQPTSGWKGSVNLKVEYGSCTPQDRDYSLVNPIANV